MINASAEFPFAGLARVELLAAWKALDGCLSTAAQVTQPIDVRKAVLIEAIRAAVMERIAMADVLLSHDCGKKES